MTDPGLRARALDWTYRQAELLCETQDPWAHGTIYRNAEFPDYSDLNFLRIRERTAMTSPELHELAEAELGRYVHRRLQFDSAKAAVRHRSYFAAQGFTTVTLTLMHFEASRPTSPDPAVREVDYDAVEPLRVSWHHEDFGADDDPTAYLADSRAVHVRLGVRTLAIFADGAPVAFADLDLGAEEVELAALYVLPEHRGRGLGTVLARSAIAGVDAEHVWIAADAHGRPRRLYARLGFRPVLTTGTFLRPRPKTD